MKLLKLMVVGGLLICASELRAQISNDTCDTAVVVTDGSTAWSNTLATASGINPGCGGTDDPIDVWFEYVATCDGTVQVDTLGTASGDTRLAIYNASLGCPTLPGDLPIDCDDDGGGGLLSSITIPVASGEAFFIQAAGYFDSIIPGGQLNISCIPSLSNDVCTTAQPIAIGSPTFFDTTGAANEWVAASCMYTAGQPGVSDLWYSVTAPSSGMLRASTCGTSSDTQIGVYLSDCSTEIGCSDDDCFASSEVDFSVSAGETYLIQVSGWGPTATVASTLTVSELSTLPPTNEDCFSALPLSSSVFFNTTVATNSSISSSCGGNGDVWYYFIAPCAGVYQFDTCGSSFDTILSVWLSNCPFGTPAPAFTCNDEATTGPCAGTSQSAVTLNLSQGGVAYLQVTGSGGAAGPGTLTASSSAAPPNDKCDAAEIVFEGTTLWTTECTSNSGVDPACGGFGPPFDVWFQYEASCSGNLVITTVAPPGDETRIALYGASFGCPIPGEIPIACSDDGAGSDAIIVWPVSIGDTFFIQAGGISASIVAPGAQLNISCLPLSTNDTCGTALPIAFDVPTPFDTAGAANEGNSGSCFFGPGGVIDLWFEVTATSSGPHRASTCSGGGDTQIAVYLSDCATEIGCSEIGCNFSSTAEVDFLAVAGETYKIQVSGTGATTTIASELVVSSLGGGGDPQFVRGDSNSDGGFNIADAIYTLAVLFTGGPLSTCTDAADANDDNAVDIADPVYTLTALFDNGTPPPAPYPACGIDAAPVGCDAFPSCP